MFQSREVGDCGDWEIEGDGAAVVVADAEADVDAWRQMEGVKNEDGGEEGAFWLCRVGRRRHRDERTALDDMRLRTVKGERRCFLEGRAQRVTRGASSRMPLWPIISNSTASCTEYSWETESLQWSPCILTC